MKKRVLTVGCFTVLITLICCSPFSVSWDSIYKDQQDFFRANKNVFEHSANVILNTKLTDTTVAIKGNSLHLPDSLLNGLKAVGIKKVEIISRYNEPNCSAKELRFIPDSLWNYEKFSVFHIQYNPCDSLSKNGYHWMAEGSDHKHSFGMGGGWLIYSDTDRDPF
ncbi:MAG: hypothetical protein EOP48_13885 [Sphingobacteriales bacterium]|nr:MAG: hypothetical protein EOP48_13885 [Sphingobacteriales bacterium]